MICSKQRKTPSRKGILAGVVYSNPKSGLDNRISRLLVINLLWGSNRTLKIAPPVMVTGGLDKLEKLWYNHAPNINGKTFPL